jgi:hypothetical protein
MAYAKQISIDPQLYWSLPGPKNFISRIRLSIANARLLWLNMPEQVVPGTWTGIEDGLHQAHIETKKLYVREGTDISSDLGVHLEQARFTAHEFAHYNQRSLAVLLIPDGPVGLKHCQQFAVEFHDTWKRNTLACSGHVIICDRNQDVTTDQHDDGISTIAFDGGLTPDEMDAYVALRMLEIPGPGSTRLTRAIVSEFAGFDVEFAEQIISLDQSQIMRICENMGILQDDDQKRWRQPSWIYRSNSLVNPGATHVLHDFYLAQHGSEFEKDSALNRIKRRYWRACIKVITPWIEERRPQVLSHFSKQINTIAAKNNGKIPNERTGFCLDPEAIEFNNIVGMVSAKVLKIETPEQNAAYVICRKVKNVRDEIAHLRMPKVNDVLDLILAMDGFLKE